MRFRRHFSSRRSKSENPVPCSQLAAEGHMPERFLLQILRHLVTHGILHSTRGVEGGYTLERKPEQVSLLDVIEAIEGPLTSALPVGRWCGTLRRKAAQGTGSDHRHGARAARVDQAVGLAELAPGSPPRAGRFPRPDLSRPVRRLTGLARPRPACYGTAIGLAGQRLAATLAVMQSPLPHAVRRRLRPRGRNHRPTRTGVGRRARGRPTDARDISCARIWPSN